MQILVSSSYPLLGPSHKSVFYCYYNELQLNSAKNKIQWLLIEFPLGCLFMEQKKLCRFHDEMINCALQQRIELEFGNVGF